MSDAREKIRHLVEQCLDRFEAEGEAAVDDVCAAHPELADRIRSRLQTLRDAGLLADEHSAGVPERLGEFRLTGRLGSGGMGVVYRAVQEPLDREVALKVVRPDQLFFPGARERFRREVDAVARLEHPGIVPIYTVGEASGVPYFAMELVRGVSLAELLVRTVARRPEDLGREDFEQVAGSGTTSGTDGSQTLWRGSWVATCCRIASRVAAALEHAHTRGVVHRDVKPSNIMLTPEGRVLLLDFGLARSAEASAMTRTGSQLGSLPYMAPEQVRGDVERVGPRTDVYALGVTLYELLTRKNPFQAETIEATRSRVLAGKVAALDEINPAVARDAGTICLKAMDPDPERRYATAGALGEDLERFLALRPIDARRPGPLLRARRAAQRNPASAILIAALAVLAVAGPVVWMLLETAAARVQKAREDARRHRERADETLRTGIAALDALLRRVDVERIRDLPGADRLCRSMLDDAMRLHASLEQVAGEDPALRELEARTLGHLARIRIVIGELSAAEADLRRAVAILEPLAAPETKAGRVARLHLSTVLDQLSVSLQKQRRFADARDVAQRQIRLVEGLVDAGAADADHLAGARHNLGNVEMFAGDLDAARAQFERSITRWRQAVERGPDRTRPLLGLAKARLNLASVLNLSGAFVEALREYRGMREDLEAVLAKEPKNLDARLELAKHHYNVAGLLSFRGRLAKATESARLSVAAHAALSAELPDRPDLADNLAMSRRHLAFLLNRQKLADEAERELESAVTEQRQLVEQYEQVDSYKAHLAAILMTRGMVQRQQGAMPDARRSFTGAYELHEELLRRKPGDSGYHYDAGVALLNATPAFENRRARRLLARAIEHLRESNRLGPDNAQTRNALAVALLMHATDLASTGKGDAAMGHLEEAVRDLGLDPARIAAAPGLEALHGRDDYRKLVGRR